MLRYAFLTAGLFLVAVCGGLCQNLDMKSLSAAPSSVAITTTSSGASVSAVFLGSYSAEGKFKNESKLVQDLRLYNDIAGQPPASLPLSSDERIVADYEPPAHAARPLKAHSAFANFRDALIVFAYGRERLLQAPTHLVTDSRGRLIVSDPGRTAVHILDTTPQNSFRIEGAPARRLNQPAGVAIDGDDNIYIADVKRGLIVVYDPEGHFLRYIGAFRGESMFQNPVALAIDRKAARLYVVDYTANELVMLDLQGHILKRIGGDRDRVNRDRLVSPSEIAVNANRVAVLDRFGSRIQVFDANCNYLNGFDVQPITGRPTFREMGLAIDSSSNIYVSNLLGSAVRVYRPEGRLISTIGHYGIDNGGFNVPSGVWIDSMDRIYVADTNNDRVQVFQVVGNSEVPDSVASTTGNN